LLQPEVVDHQLRIGISRRRLGGLLQPPPTHQVNWQGSRAAAARTRLRPGSAGSVESSGVAAIRIDIAAGSVYLRSCPSGTQSTSGPPLDFSEIEITPGLKRMLGASHVIRSGGQPCSPRARRSRRGPARS
jgi:hypothetical protein